MGRRYRKRFVAVLPLPSLSFRWICKFSDDKPLDGTGSRLHFPSNIASFDVIIARALLTLGHIDKHVSLEIEGYERVEGKRRWLRNWWSEIVICGGENDGWKKVDRTNIICFSRGNVSKIWLWRSSLSPWLLLFSSSFRGENLLWGSLMRNFSTYITWNNASSKSLLRIGNLFLCLQKKIAQGWSVPKPLLKTIYRCIV